MANETNNYKLLKPLKGEFYNVDVQNGNMEIIDSAMKAISNKANEGIADKAVTNTKMADMEAMTIKGNNTTGTASPKNLTKSEVQTMLEDPTHRFVTESEKSKWNAEIGEGLVKQFNIITDAQAYTGFIAGDIIEVLGYNNKNDYSGHFRKIEVANDGSGVAVGDKWANLLPKNGKVMFSWFGKTTNCQVEFVNACTYCASKGYELCIDGIFSASQFKPIDVDNLTIKGDKGFSKLIAVEPSVSSTHFVRCDNLVLDGVHFKCPSNLSSSEDTLRIHGSVGFRGKNLIVEGSGVVGFGTKGFRFSDIDGVEQLACSDGILENSTLFNANGQNVWIEGSCNNIKVINNTMYGAFEEDFGTDKGGSTEVPSKIIFKGNTCKSTSTHNIYIKSLYDSIICDNFLYNATVTPIQLGIDGATRYIRDVKVHNNKGWTTGSYGVFIGDNNSSSSGISSRIIVENNEIYKTNNEATSEGQYGLKANRSDVLKVKNNLFHNFAGYGVKVDYCGSAEIEENTFLTNGNNMYEAFRAVDSTQVKFKNNKCLVSCSNTYSVNFLGTVTGLLVEGNTLPKDINPNIKGLNNNINSIVKTQNSIKEFIHNDTTNLSNIGGSRATNTSGTVTSYIEHATESSGGNSGRINFYGAQTGNYGLRGYMTGGGSWYNIAGAWSAISDERLKTKIEDVNNASEKIIKLANCVKHFEYLDPEKSHIGKRTQYIAQLLIENGFEGHVIEQDPTTEFEKSIVGEGKILTVEQNFTPYLIKALSEQIQKNKELEERLIKLELK